MARRTRATLPRPPARQPRSLERPDSVTRRWRTRACVARETGAMRSAQPPRMPLENVGTPAPASGALGASPGEAPAPDDDVVEKAPAARPALAGVKHAFVPSWTAT